LFLSKLFWLARGPFFMLLEPCTLSLATGALKLASTANATRTNDQNQSARALMKGFYFIL